MVDIMADTKPVGKREKCPDDWETTGRSLHAGLARVSHQWLVAGRYHIVVCCQEGGKITTEMKSVYFGNIFALHIKNG